VVTSIQHYLTPNKGLFTTDIWLMVAIWLRNTSLESAHARVTVGTILRDTAFASRDSGFAVLHCCGNGRPELASVCGYLLPSVLVAGFGVYCCWFLISALHIAQQGRVDPTTGLIGENLRLLAEKTRASE
jgi:hypothetical protein